MFGSSPCVDAGRRQSGHQAGKVDVLELGSNMADPPPVCLCPDSVVCIILGYEEGSNVWFVGQDGRHERRVSVSICDVHVTPTHVEYVGDNATGTTPCCPVQERTGPREGQLVYPPRRRRSRLLCQQRFQRLHIVPPDGNLQRPLELLLCKRSTCTPIVLHKRQHIRHCVSHSAVQ